MNIRLGKHLWVKQNHPGLIVCLLLFKVWMFRLHMDGWPAKHRGIVFGRTPTGYRVIVVYTRWFILRFSGVNG